jgi:hypothetical protein
MQEGANPLLGWLGTRSCETRKDAAGLDDFDQLSDEIVDIGPKKLMRQTNSVTSA